jgi:predicted metalloprotease with PDZ domain
MGNSASQEEIDAVGYRVLGVQPNSPAACAGLVSFFDFVVAANEYPLKALDQVFVEMIKESENKPLPLTIYNIKSETTRDVVITPRRNWGGQGMLGVTIRFDSFWRAEESLVRVLEVLPDSPAELAGLEPEKDYLLGTAERVFKDTDTLFDEVQKHLDSTLEFFVYNTATDEVRVVVIMPTNNWNGKGCLGLSVGHGYLHRLPHRCKQSTGRSIEPSRPMVPNLTDATADAAAPAATTTTGGVGALPTRSGGPAVDAELPPKN